MEEKIEKKRECDPMFIKFIKESKNLGEAMDKMKRWQEKME